MLGKMKDMYKLQKQAKQIKKKLKNIHIEAEEKGVIVTTDGEQNIISVSISDEAMQNKGILEKNIKEAINKATKKSQQIAAEEMKAVMGDMGLPGM
jgi:DNA-binding YbaB/EbfC family protein